MKMVLSPEAPDALKDHCVGGKGRALITLAMSGMKVPDVLLVTTGAYESYVRETGLREQILLELNRKRFDDMRWEEIWDASLRIRHFFLNTPIPEKLRTVLAQSLRARFEERAVVVRSSAPGEDASRTSFAGLHESYVNVLGTEAMLDHIVLVWASLWSNRALLYRRELGLDVRRSAMAVVVQEMVPGERSGVAFSRNPLKNSQAIIEAVYGLNQGLVDGIIEPDRWTLDRETGRLIDHHPASRHQAFRPAALGTRLEPVSREQRAAPPLGPEDIARVYDLVTRAEVLFGSPQDMEWTFGRDTLHVLQSRPITTHGAQEDDDGRRWYLGLQKSFESLKTLRNRVEQELIPSMAEEAGKLPVVALQGLSDLQLAEEVAQRTQIYEKWRKAYWTDCIPFAHGMRLFGQVYNDMMRPADPYEFMDLLRGQGMFSIRRNQKLQELASMLRKDPELARGLNGGEMNHRDPAFAHAFNTFLGEFGDSLWGGQQFSGRLEALTQLLEQMASQEPGKNVMSHGSPKDLEEEFLNRFRDDQRPAAAELLDIARASYRLRDDDNIYLGRFESYLLSAVAEARRRIQRRHQIDVRELDREEIMTALKDPEYTPREPRGEQSPSESQRYRIRARQLVGQPAGPGYAVGKARLILDPDQLFEFQAGEVLVCDAVDPNMTFVVPLAAGIVERRGGMLIHGAIIAREYGIPCVTGVPEATRYIEAGEQIAVDGYLGVVILG